ncbi:single-stranded-DNA-specific exonuclease RecJ [Oricola cellulosilytica]|uniref:Single-stranded-DNA-specific exonuclease RecJ n=1 Tax=Oricola cellulosilytica TaxID=1429082 RepID=A0A4R0P6V5_9HYPH|nr:single-stranded-DNA-specific exonuclease RecJ [Oricola cellulosilytica]TCD12399.1 single-stranded-DNA-specific exonuclease RecJ [Oricola cellulosilytica]
MTNGKAFLGVERSAKQRRWIDRMSAAQAQVAVDIAQRHGLSDVLSRVLAGRGVSADQALSYLDPTMKMLMPDPRSVTALEAAAQRIADAITHGESVAIFGDYDVDGAASSALLARYLRFFGLDAEIYIPDRIFEGYGPNADAIRQLADRASLIVTVDCGTNSKAVFDAVDDARCDVVVLDHHQVGGELPDVVAVVNPNRDDDLSGLGNLCAAGVVFMTLVEVSRLLRGRGSDVPDLLSMLDLVALATVCDVVPLTGLNRAFVTKGLIAARHLNNPGLAALARVASIGEPINPFHLGFLIGPRINAGGRIGDAALGARMLSEDDRDRAGEIAAELDRLNKERQAIEAGMVEEAKAEADRDLQSNSPPSIIVTSSRDWHPGIVGLIAARLKEHTRRPAFAIALDGSGKGTGSGRSIPGFDLGGIVRAAVEAGILVKGGGHAMAAGLTVDAERLGELRDFFEEKASAKVGKLIDTESQPIDGAISARGATATLIGEMEKAGPFGSGSPEPVFVLPSHRVVSSAVVGNGHLKLRLRGQEESLIEAIAFRAADSELGQFLIAGNGSPVHVAGTLSLNYWNGQQTPQMRILDAAKPI